MKASDRNVIPCGRSDSLRESVETFARELSEQAHLIGTHGLSEKAFYEAGILDGAIERLRGQRSARMGEKREFVRHILNYLEDQGRIVGWDSAGSDNRFDYQVDLIGGRICIIELKGCLDGNNTTIYERPASANEFVMWSVCQNKSADMEHNVWSGIHTRLGAEMISQPSKRLDGLVVWDFLCGTLARPCPKIGSPSDPSNRVVELGPYRLPPPCIYLFPATVPTPKDNPNPPPQKLEDVSFLSLLHDVFNGAEDELNYVQWEAGMKDVSLTRKVEVTRCGVCVAESRATKVNRKG